MRNCFSGLRYLMMAHPLRGRHARPGHLRPFLPEEVGDLGADLKSLEGEFDLRRRKS